MFQFGFDAAGIPTTTSGGHCAASEDSDMMEMIAFAQGLITLLIFFAVAPLLASLKEFRTWMIYKGTWLGLFIQVLFLTIASVIVVFEISAYSQEALAWALILNIGNTAWFVLLRVVRLVRDHC